MESEAPIKVLVHIEAQAIAAADVLQRPGDFVGGAGLDIQPIAEIAAEMNPGGPRLDCPSSVVLLRQRLVGARA